MLKNDIQASWDQFAKSGSVDDYLRYHLQVVEALKATRGQIYDDYYNNGTGDSPADGIRKG